MKYIDRFVNWVIYWFVPENATEKEKNDRVFEVGMCIGMIVGFMGVVIWRSVT